MEYRENLFPGESYEKTLAFIESIKRLVPINSDNKIGYLEEVFSYVNDLINGDEIRQYCSSTGPVSKYAKKAFQEIIRDVHEQELESFRRERRELQTEINSLSDRKETLSKEVDGLERNNRELKEQTGNISLELAKLLRELQDKKENGIKEANAAVDNEKKRLQDEIASLNSTKENLSVAVADLKKSLNDYNNIITELDKPKESVIWEPIKEDDPIYNTNAETIDSYIKQLKLVYKDKTGATDEQCEDAFEQNANLLNEFACTLKAFKISEHSSYATVKGIIKCVSNITWKDYHPKEKGIVKKLCATLKILKMPVYQPVKGNIDSHSVELDTVPNNINSMLRELYFQRIALEAVAKQRILEAELKSVVGLLIDVAPQNYDFRSLVETYSEFDNPSMDEIKDYLDKNSKVYK